MRTPLLMLIGALVVATPMRAQDNLNVEQPSRITTQSGQTSGGPIDTGLYSGGSAGEVVDGPPVVEDGPAVAVPGLAADPRSRRQGVVVVPVR